MIGDGRLVEPAAFVQQIPLQTVPPDLTLRVADLGFAGRYIPAGPGPEPIAGDFYDVLRLDDDLVAVVVGDVAGHGDTALARMQQLRGAARAYAVGEAGPAAVIRRLDKFCARLDPESVATVWYGEYRPSSGTLTYASAGHLPPVLTAHGDPSRLLDLATTPPLGIGVADELAVEHVEVLPLGSILVAYSDGLVERPGKHLDEQLGLLTSIVERACDPARAAAPTAIAAEILGTLIPDPGAALDDVCLLVVRRQPV